MADEDDQQNRDESQDDAERIEQHDDVVLEDEEFDLPRAKAKITKVNKEAQSLRRRVKELEPLAAKAQELEDRDKTEAQKSAEDKDVAVKDAADARAEVLRLRMAMKYGLDEEDLDLLGTGDEEQIEARAKRLADRFGPVDDPKRRPRERLRPGAVPDADMPELDSLSPRELLRLAHSKQ